MVGEARGSSQGLIQRAHDRFYDRYGARGLVSAAGVGSIASLGAVTLLVCAASVSLLAVSWNEILPIVWLGELTCLLGVAVGVLATRGDIRLVLEWSGENRTPERAAELWAKGLTLPTTVTVRSAAALYTGVVFVMLPVVVIDFDLPLWTYAVMVVMWVFIVCAGAVYYVLGLELLFRPQIRDVAEHLPPDFEPTMQAMSLRTKVSLPVPAAIMFAVMFATSFADTSQSYGTRIVVGASIGLVCAAITIVLYYLAAHAALDPVDQLTDATERVRQGDLDTPVPLLGADELGRLATSFNQMLEGLRERESLRVHNAELLEDVQASRARIVAAADDERRRMERDLHDGAQQRLVLINLKLGMLGKTLESDPAAAKALLSELRDDAAHAIDELRDLAHGIYPALLESDGLAAALSDVGDQSQFPVFVAEDGTGRYPSEVEAAVYFCCLEALQNCAKHAGDGSHARIELREADRTLHFAVRDDGHGFDRASVIGSAGLQNMADRIGALGGRLDVLSAPGDGTSVEGTVPV